MPHGELFPRPVTTYQPELIRAGSARRVALIDVLLHAGITPSVTIFHFDTPQVLQKQYRGFLCERIVRHFVFFAQTCFERFGDRVRNWSTINEVSVTFQIVAWAS